VSISFTTTSYSISLTDLANMWTEQMDRKAIYMRGFKEDTSIDPSEDSTQMRLFLSKIESAFDPLHAEHRKSSVNLSIDEQSDYEAHCIVLQVSCLLPGSLRPLAWPMYLKKDASASLAAGLVVPLIKSYSLVLDKVDRLLEIIDLKDKLITRLLDKHESSGAGLDTLFTTLSGKRNITRAAAQEKIKGLAPFNHEDFNLLGFNQYSIGNMDTSVKRLFGGIGLRCEREDGESITSSDLNNWWKTSTNQSVIPISAQTDEEAQEITATPPANTAEDDDFQIQSTPPHLASSRTHRIKVKKNVGNDGDEDSDVSQIPDSNPILTKRRKHALDQDTIESIPSHQLVRDNTSSMEVQLPIQDDLQSETASEDEMDRTASLSPKVQSLTVPIFKVPVKKGGLGRIGGQKTAETRAPAPEKFKSVDKSDPGETETPIQMKIGHIGSRIDNTKLQNTGDAGFVRGRTNDRADTVDGKGYSTVRETSKERADRKRLELQRELDKKTAAGPARKKRRF
jgi:hypothetical protein